MSTRVPPPPADPAPLLERPKPLPPPNWLEIVQGEMKQRQDMRPVAADQVNILENIVESKREAYEVAADKLLNMKKSVAGAEPIKLQYGAKTIELLEAKGEMDEALIEYYIAENKKLSFLASSVSEDLQYYEELIGDISKKNDSLEEEAKEAKEAKEACENAAEKRAATSKSLTAPLVADATWLDGVCRAVSQTR